MYRAAGAATILVLAVPAGAEAATLETDRPCYVDAPGQLMTVTGAELTPGSAWNVTGGGLDESGTADGAGAFAFETGVPTIGGGIKPRSFSLSATQDGTEVANTSFKVVNFLAMPTSLRGKPTSTTSWGFSGFTPGKQIFVHIKRAGKVYTDKAGRGDGECGTLKTRLRRLPAVPANKIQYGAYKVYVDNKRKFSKGGLQYAATITIFRRSS